ncbi:MAG: TetR family transcriptional regulator [Anaerolineales bacterium]|nr:MAG: TetR family transcriptional regulator [Anaerolineales bacterium]
MEKFASDFYNNYRRLGQIDLLANNGGKKKLPIFLLRVVIELVFHSRKYDVIHLYDAVLSPLIFFVRLFSKAKVTFTVNGLDIVYSRLGYQIFMPFFLMKADKIIAISQYTMEQCVMRGIPKEKLMVIPVGYNFKSIEVLSVEKRIATMSKYGISWREKKILITVGRLVKRKGHAWFIEHVLIELPKDYIYLIIGDGPELKLLSKLVTKLDLIGRVYLLGRVSDEEKGNLYQMADLFVMPNIHVEGDQEGFGIVLLEAGQYGLPVIASNIEGVRDAVLNGKSGMLIDEKNSMGFIDSILRFNPDKSAILPALNSKFNWDKVITAYFEMFQDFSV